MEPWDCGGLRPADEVACWLEVKFSAGLPEEVKAKLDILVVLREEYLDLQVVESFVLFDCVSSSVSPIGLASLAVELVLRDVVKRWVG